MTSTVSPPHVETKVAIADAPTTQNCEFRATSETLKALRIYWNRCSNNDEWFHRLWDMHTHHTRHYHTAVHLLEMCKLLDIVLTGTQDSDYHITAILLAVFFHDAVYDAHSSTNEEDSAKLFETFAFTGANVDSSSTKQKVSDWILATKTHQASVAAANDPSLRLFLDLDMAVLGKTASAYLEYAKLIRREYSFVPAATYCEKRTDVLESFLQQPYIYGDLRIRDALEQRARENLATEIGLLRQGIIPGESGGNTAAIGSTAGCSR